MVSHSNQEIQQNQQQNTQTGGIRSESPLSTSQQQQQQQQKTSLFTNLNPLNARPVFGASASNPMGTKLFFFNSKLLLITFR